CKARSKQKAHKDSNSVATQRQQDKQRGNRKKTCCQQKQRRHYKEQHIKQDHSKCSKRGVVIKSKESLGKSCPGMGQGSIHVTGDHVYRIHKSQAISRSFRETS